MTGALTEGHGLTAVRLPDIPIKLRTRAANQLLQIVTPLEGLRIGVVAKHPSDTVYWIPTSAYLRVMG